MQGLVFRVRFAVMFRVERNVHETGQVRLKVSWVAVRNINGCSIFYNSKGFDQKKKLKLELKSKPAFSFDY